MNILNPYTWLAGLLAIVLCFGAGYVSGRHDGNKITTAKWQVKELDAAQDAARKLEDAQRHADEVEAASQKAMVAASETYQKGIANVQAQRDQDRAAYHAGLLRLRDPGKYALGPNSMPQAGPSTGGCDGQAGSELSEPSAEFLLGLAAEADVIANQLTACQAIVKQDREQ